jgi:hypothetical protein
MTKVVINPYSYHHIIMKLIILHLGVVNRRHSFPRVSWRFESIVNLERKITWQHDTREPQRLHEWQPFTLRSKSQSGSYLTIVPSSTRMPQWTHRGWPDTIPYDIHKEVGYHPTQCHMMLVSLWDPMKSRMRQYTTQSVFIQIQLTRALIDSGGGYMLELWIYDPDHFLSFPSSILHNP